MDAKRPLGDRRRLGRVALLFGVLLAAAFLRLFRLDETPPQLHIDLAINLQNAQDILAGQLLVFFPRHEGREALDMYYLAGLMLGAGGNPFILSYSAMAMGMLSVALLFALGRAMFGWRVGLLAAAVYALAFPTLQNGRFGERPDMIPPLLIAALYGLWGIYRRRRARDAWLLGICAGLCLYTYIPSRAEPVLLVALCLVSPRESLRRWRPLLAGAAICTLVFLPEGVYFLQHPDQALLRQNQVSVFNPNPRTTETIDTPWQSVVKTAGWFFVRGDENPRYNIPYRPYFDPLFGGLFVVGLGVCLFRIRSRRVYAWPVVWIVVMSLPAALSHAAPDSLRAIGAQPAICLLPALALFELPFWLRKVRGSGNALTQPSPRGRGLMGAGSELAGSTSGLAGSGIARNGPGRAWRFDWGAGVLQVGALGYLGVTTGAAYFGTWAHSIDTYWTNDGNLPKLAQVINGRAEQRVFLSLAARPSVEYLAPRSKQADWYSEESAAIPVPLTPEDALYIGGRSSVLGGLAGEQLVGAEALPHTNDPAGGPDFFAFRWAAAAQTKLLESKQPLRVTIGPDFELDSYELVRDGAGAPAVDLLWRPLNPAGPYDLYVHVLDGARQLAQSDRLVWPVDEGPASDAFLMTSHPLPGPGTYTLEIGAVHRSSTDSAQLVGGPIGVTKVDVRVS